MYVCMCVYGLDVESEGDCLGKEGRSAVEQFLRVGVVRLGRGLEGVKGPEIDPARSCSCRGRGLEAETEADWAQIGGGDGSGLGVEADLRWSQIGGGTDVDA
jgi:hypothetical protein